MTGERNKSMRKTLSTENFKIHVFGTDDNSFKLEVLSTEETQQHIAESVIGKLAVWSSVLQEQAPSRSEELATSLKTAYPDYINTGVIDLGVKVLLGEIQWG